MTAIRELVTNQILVTWNEGEDTPSSLLSSLNVYLDFLSGFDRFLAHSTGWDCDVNLVLDGLEERGFRFSLTYNLLPSSQLYLGQGEAMADLLAWLEQMHGELLQRMLELSDRDDLEELLARARRRAEEAFLSREFIFTLEPGPRKLAFLEKRFSELLAARNELSGRVALKILKK